MHRLKMSLLSSVIVTVLTTLLLTTGVAKAAPLTCGSWSVVSSSNVVGAPENYLDALAVISTTNVWAVGDYRTTSGNTLTLIEHWNGRSWSIVASPNAVGSDGNNFYGVTALSASNIWAVGYSNSNAGNQTLIENWNGSSWSIVASPNAGPTDNFLNSVTALSATNIWAVGNYFNTSGVNQTLIENWNGSSWSVVTSPNVGSKNNFLYGVTALSATNIWAVGGYANSSNVGQTLIENWNGSSWSVVASPNVGSGENFLSSVTALSTSNVWAVGYDYNSSNVGQTLTEHWNGSSWSVVSSLNVGLKSNFLYGVTALTASNVWAVGYDYNSSNVGRTLIEHWNGSSWKVVSSPNVGSKSNFLFGVARAPGSSNVWTVGYYDNSTGIRTLTEFYC